MTFIGYPNIEAVSDNGQFRVEITGSPVDDFFRDQGNFVYRLYDSNRLVWEWHGDKHHFDDYPHDAWVSNEGWVVVRTHEWFHGGLLVISPEGKPVLRQMHRKLIESSPPGFLDDEPYEYMGDSSAGPFWARSAFAFFVENEGRKYWCIRTWWGRRVIIDLAGAKVCPPDALPTEMLQGIECNHVLKVLSERMDRLENEGERILDEKEYHSYRLLAVPVKTASYQAGWLKEKKAVPYLRRLEHIHIIGPRGFMEWGHLNILIFRQVAKLSLLRMGIEPQWIAHYLFEQAAGFYKFPQDIPHHGVSALKSGMTQKEVLQVLGAPDFISGDWDYDVFYQDKMMTTRIKWDKSHLEGIPYKERKLAADQNPPRISAIMEMEPQWQKITRRDHWVVH